MTAVNVTDSGVAVRLAVATIAIAWLSIGVQEGTVAYSTNLRTA